MGRGWEMVGKEEGQWYTNKELYEMMVDLSKKLEKTNEELSKTQVMIRDYNGLRERLNECERRVDQVFSSGQGQKDMWGYVVGGIGLLLALLSWVVKR